MRNIRICEYFRSLKRKKKGVPTTKRMPTVAGTQPGRALNCGRDFLKNSLAEESRRAEMLEKTLLDPRQDTQQRSPDKE